MTPKERAAEWRKRWTSEKFDSLFADIMERSVEKVAADAEADLIASMNGSHMGDPGAHVTAQALAIDGGSSREQCAWCGVVHYDVDLGRVEAEIGKVVELTDGTTDGSGHSSRRTARFDLSGPSARERTERSKRVEHLERSDRADRSH